MSERLATLQATLEEPFLVTDVVNVRYLCGLASSNAALLVEPDGVHLFTDFRYAESARAVEGVEFVETRRNLMSSLAQRLSGRIAFEAASLTYAAYVTLEGGGVELVPRWGVVEALRSVKDDGELAAIRRAAAITSEAYARLAEEPFVGRSERELAWHMETLFHELGADAPAFPVIVAAGANAAKPHVEPGDRPVERGDAVIVDAGCTIGGYCADCTRTFAAGPLSDELGDTYELVRRAQEAGVRAARPGVSGVEADRAARSVIEAGGHGEQFGHGLGHGVGLLVHEAPRLSTESEDVLAAGNVVTVEPGVYLSGRGGIRIEDLVVVDEDEPEVLTSFTKELVDVG